MIKEMDAEKLFAKSVLVLIGYDAPLGDFVREVSSDGNGESQR